MSFTYERIEEGVKKSVFDDSRMREKFIEFAKKTLGLEFKNGSLKGIDCVFVDDENSGAEGENASWSGDRWKSGQRDLFNLGINTLNIQNRKWFYWGMGELSKININKNRNLKTHPGFLKNLYFRINKEEDQIIIVYSDVIRDSTKVKIIRNRTVRNSNEPEDWICIPQEHTLTYNKQPNGEWLLNGPYWAKTAQERLKELSQKKNK